MSQNNVYPSGYLVFVEGDKEEWFQAFEWQKNEFIKAMKFGTMKTMCYPNPITKSKPLQFRMHFKTIHPVSLLLSLASNTLVSGLNSGRTRVSSSANIPTTLSSPSSLEFKQSAELSCTFNIDSIQIEDQPVEITSAHHIEVKWLHQGRTFISYRGFAKISRNGRKQLEKRLKIIGLSSTLC